MVKFKLAVLEDGINFESVYLKANSEEAAIDEAHEIARKRYGKNIEFKIVSMEHTVHKFKNDS